MAGTNLFAALTTTLDICMTDETGLALTAKCTGTPPTTASTFQHGCLITQTDSGTGVAAVFQNTGSTAVPVWTLLDTALPGDSASKLIDTNSLTVVDVATVATTVNNLRVTGSATGAVGANAVTLTSVGTDAAVSLSLAPKGATGLTTIGLATGTGAITVGSSSGAQQVIIGGGAGIPTISIADAAVAGATVNIATALGTSVGNAINIGTGATTVAGGNTILIGSGTPTGAGTNLITIGSTGNTANVTTIQGGNGTGAIRFTPQITGTIVMGAAAGTGAITIGSSSTTQTTNIGTGAGVSTLNLATGAAANVVTVGAAASLVTLKGTQTAYLATNRCTGSAVANAPVATLTDAAGANVTVATGLRITLALAAGLQAGANTLNLNSAGAASIKSHRNSATDIAAAYDASGIVDLLFNGTAWLDMSQ